MPLDCASTSCDESLINLFIEIQKGRQYMSKLIKNGRIVSDAWKTLTLAEGDTPQSVRLPVGPVLVPLSVWRGGRAGLRHPENLQRRGRRGAGCRARGGGGG